MREMVRLGDVGTIITGNTPKTSDKENYSSKDIPFIKPSDISETEISTINCSEYYIAEQAKNKARIIPINSILVTCIGIIGKIGINKIECAFNQQINSIIPDLSKCISEYLAYAIYSRKLFLQNIANAPVVPILNKSQFSDIEIPLPPLPEQRHIAAVLDKVSELIALRKRQLDLLDEMVKARFVEMFGDFKTNPNGYSECFLSDVCCIGSSKRIYQNELQNDGVPFLRISDLMKRIIYNFQTCDLYISKTQYDDLVSKNLVPKAGEILVTSRGTLGECYIIKDDDYFYFQDGMISWIYDLDKKVLPIFIVLLFKTHFIKDQIDKYQSGSTVAYLSIAMLKKIKIIVPPIVLQTQFADFVQQVEKTKATVQQGLDRLNLLKSALMQEYFG